MKELLTKKGKGYVALIQEPHVIGGRPVGWGQLAASLHAHQQEEGERGPRACILVSNDLNAWFLPNFSDRDMTTVRMEGVGPGEPP